MSARTTCSGGLCKKCDFQPCHTIRCRQCGFKICVCSKCFIPFMDWIVTPQVCVICECKDPWIDVTTPATAERTGASCSDPVTEAAAN